LLARDDAGGIATRPNWGSIGDALTRFEAAPLIIAPATILAEIDWLQSIPKVAIEPSGWALIPHRLIVIASAAIADAIVALKADGGADTMTSVQDRLTRRLGPPVPVPIGIDPMAVTTTKDIALAERRLLRSLIKANDGFMARHVDRRISLQISRRLADSAVTPTQITMISIAIGLCGAAFFLSPLWYWQTVGALLVLFHSIVDGCDGELARLKFQESRYGGMLDFWGDNVVHVAIFGCMAVGWTLSSGLMWPLLLGGAATAGTLGSASFVYWRQIRLPRVSGPLFTSVSSAPNDRLARLLDAASRRDFLYLLPVLALFGRSSWILVLAALGAPLFLIVLVFQAVRQRDRAGGLHLPPNRRLAG
jgi:1L-myo-inositol 1-phosphate cytidylyltransferase / CDP-L-myo-inositol myo-inositolphosphotransferase